MIEYLTQDFYYANRKIINDINWLNTNEKYEYNAGTHKFDIKYYVYRIEGVTYTSNTLSFRTALEKGLMWERLGDQT